MRSFVIEITTAIAAMCLWSARHGCESVLGITTQVDRYGFSIGMGCSLTTTIGRIIMQYAGF